MPMLACSVSVELKSGRVRKVSEPGDYYTVTPYMSFYTPGMVLDLASLIYPAFYSFHMSLLRTRTMHCKLQSMHRSSQVTSQAQSCSSVVVSDFLDK